MKKILRITTVSHSIDLLLKGQLKFLSTKNFEVHIACSYDEVIENVAKRENSKYHKLEQTRTLSPFKDLLSLFNAIILIKKIKPDIVHTHSPKAGIVGMLAAFLCNVPLRIHTVAGLPLVEAKGFKKRLLIWVEKLTYSCANFVLPNSINQKKYIEDNIYKGAKLKIIGKGSSNGIDLDFFSKKSTNIQEVNYLNTLYKIDNKTTVFCFVGRLAYYKGINELVESFVVLNTKYENIKLLLVGPYENLNPLKESTTYEIKKNKNIITTGHKNDIRPFLFISDIFVFPSYREGFPQSLMQASAMELPCIATNINGCNEIIENNVNGILIEPKNKNELLSSMELLLKNRKIKSHLKSNSRNKMEEFYEQKKFWGLILDFYKLNLDNNIKRK